MSARRFLEVDDLTPAQFAAVLDVAEKGKADPSGIPQLLTGQGVVLLFEKPSARTRASTEMAVVSLGGHPIYVRPEEVGLGVRESVADVARTFAGFCSVLAARVFDHATLEEMAAVIDIPVVNLLSDRAHPTQAVADFLTLRELLRRARGPSARLRRRRQQRHCVARVRSRAVGRRARGGVAARVRARRPHGRAGPQPRRLVELGHDPYDAVAGADAVYTDVWTSMGQEEETALRRAAFAGFTVDDEMLRCAHPDAWFLHCLPAHRGEEVAASVIDGPRSAVWQQATNRMHAARGVLTHLLGHGAAH